jgi:hypothetical protein
MNKEDKRGTVQPFIVAMQFTSALLLIAAGKLDGKIAISLFYSVPALLAGTILGLTLCRNVTEARFRSSVLWALMFSGLVLAVRTITG